MVAAKVNMINSVMNKMAVFFIWPFICVFLRSQANNIMALKQGFLPAGTYHGNEVDLECPPIDLNRLSHRIPVRRYRLRTPLADLC